LQRLSELAGEMNLLLSDRRDRLELKYRPSVSLSDSFDLESIEQSFLEHIGRIQYEETLRGSTLVGPQRDDMTILVNGEDGRFFGSQGQQRTITLSLKFAERQLIEELMGEPPILLLDDVLSDLDDIRSARLYDLISKSGSQTFLSCTSVRSFSGDILQSASVWKVTKGEAALTR
jgi:DNA replication and repair protein RecF